MPIGERKCNVIVSALLIAIGTLVMVLFTLAWNMGRHGG
jgi:hypothetical protein